MKRALRWTLLLGVLALAWNLYGPSPALMLGVPQTGASHLPPDAPPAGPPMPGDPVELRPKRPGFPQDFLDNSRDVKPHRKMVDAVQAQKDAEELAGLAKKIQGEVGQLSRSLLSKDLDKELKQIQKLAKRLRGEITP